MVLRPLLPVALSVLCVAPAGARAADAPADAPLRDAMPVARFGGVTAFSERVAPGPTAAFRLVLRRGGVTAAAPVPTRSVPFDVDLGPGPSGSVMAVYSRCRIEPDLGYTPLVASYTDGSGCRLFALGVDGGGERRLPGTTPGASEVLPSVWGDRVAFARGPGRPGAATELVVRGLDGSDVRRQARAADAARPGGTPRAIDLHGSRTGVVWSRASRGGEGSWFEARLGRVDAGSTVVARTGGGGMSQAYFAGAGFLRGRFVFALDCFGDPGGCGDRGLRRKLVRVGASGALQAARLPLSGIAASTADESGVSVVIAGTATTTGTGRPTDHPFARLLDLPADGLTFGAAPRPIRPRVP